MAEQLMETTLRTALWRQFGATIEALENILLACPTSLWKERLWSAPSDHSLPKEFGEFWYIAYHTLFWLDLYLSGSPEEDFVPPLPLSGLSFTPRCRPSDLIQKRRSLPIWSLHTASVTPF